MDKDALEMRYLLGKLSESESARLEERYFTENSVFDEVETAEDELVDAYVRGSLSSDDRQRFEAKILKSERLKERVEFARLLSKLPASTVVDREPARAPWWNGLFNFSLPQSAALRGALAVGIFLIVVGVPAGSVWLRVRDERRLESERAAIEQQKQQLAQQLAEQQSRTNKLASDLQNSKAEEERLQRELLATQEELARLNAQPAAPASIFLFAASSRAPGSRDVLTVPSNASTVQLKLVVDSDDYATYQATIKSPSDPNVLTRANLKPTRSGKARIISLQFPSRVLSSGDYLVTLTGRTADGTYERVADYPVRVSKK
jgi:hypothetical protein